MYFLSEDYYLVYFFHLNAVHFFLRPDLRGHCPFLTLLLRRCQAQRVLGRRQAEVRLEGDRNHDDINSRTAGYARDQDIYIFICDDTPTTLLL